MSAHQSTVLFLQNPAQSHSVCSAVLCSLQTEISSFPWPLWSDLGEHQSVASHCIISGSRHSLSVKLDNFSSCSTYLPCICYLILLFLKFPCIYHFASLFLKPYLWKKYGIQPTCTKKKLQKMRIFMFKQKQIKKIVSEHLTRKVRIHQTNLKKNRRITSRLKKILKNLTKQIY